MNEIEIDILESIKKWVWSGYYLPDEVHEMLDDILEEEVNENTMRQAIDAEFARKVAEEREWPSVTDCDRINYVFYSSTRAASVLAKMLDTQCLMATLMSMSPF